MEHSTLCTMPFVMPIGDCFHWFLDDYLILVTERTRTMEGQTEELKDFTVMFAKRPYNSWSILFSGVGSFVIYDDDSQEGSDVHTHNQRIKDIIGIFFNHHVRHFDITMYVTVSDRSSRIILKFLYKISN